MSRGPFAGRDSRDHLLSGFPARDARERVTRGQFRGASARGSAREVTLIPFQVEMYQDVNEQGRDATRNRDSIHSIYQYTTILTGLQVEFFTDDDVQEPCQSLAVQCQCHLVTEGQVETRRPRASAGVAVWRFRADPDQGMMRVPRYQ